MGRLCTVCCHPQHRAINAALLEHRVGYRVVAGRFGLAPTSVQRHQNEHLPVTLQRSKEARAMLDAESLARRMAALDAHVDKVLESAGRDKRLTLQAVAEGRKNLDSWMRLRLIVLHAAQQSGMVDAEGYPIIPQLPENPERIRTVLRMLIESGAALSPPSIAQPATPEERRQPHNDEDDDRGYTTTPAV